MRKAERRRWKVAAAAAAALLAACATTERVVAAADVRALLVSIRDNDEAAFDAHVDRGALERELEGRILQSTGGEREDQTTRSLGALLAGPISRLAGEALLRPSVFLAVAEYYGYKPGQPIPGQIAIAEALRALPDGRVCAAKGKSGPCLLTFANEGGTWRLVSFDGDLSLLKLPH